VPHGIAAKWRPGRVLRAMTTVTQAGIGAIINAVDGGLKITSINLDGGAAASDNVQIGDFLVAINGVPLTSEAHAKELILGTYGTSLEVQLSRNGQLFTVTLWRGGTVAKIKGEAAEKAKAEGGAKSAFFETANALQQFGDHANAEQVFELNLDRISEIAGQHRVHVCVYGCSGMDEGSKLQNIHDYQKVLKAMREDDLKIIAPSEAVTSLYCVYCKNEEGTGYLRPLDDLGHNHFGWHASKAGGGSGGWETCGLCAWAYPFLDPHFKHEKKDHHIRTVLHQRALTCAVLFHALQSFGDVLKDLKKKKTERKKRGKSTSSESENPQAMKTDPRFNFPFSDIIFWYLHHDRVPHACEGEKIIKQILEIYRDGSLIPIDILNKLRLLITICIELNLSHQISQELKRKNDEKNAWKKLVDDDAVFCFCDDIDLGMECLFQSNFFVSFQPSVEHAEKEGNQQEIEQDSPIKFLVETLSECDDIQTLSRSSETKVTSSFPTKQWIFHAAGQGVKLHGHGVNHIYDSCEVEKTSNMCERWRHMIYSYALCSLLWNEFNGNKEGPIGFYPQRRNQVLGSIQRHNHQQERIFCGTVESLQKNDAVKFRIKPCGKFSQIGMNDVGTIHETFEQSTSIPGFCRVRFGEYLYLCPTEHLEKVEPTQREHVYASKKNGEPLNYVGHNIVAFAVGKRGDILRVAYNHNVLFTSTVDHAEERLIDSLYRDPTAFVQKSHSEILDDKETIDVEKHMQHISVYTSLEPCQQCSGKMHVALVPEVVFCQRDWDIQLHLGEMYEKFRKTRSVPASNFNFPPYEQLATGYYEFQRLIDEDKPSFFQKPDDNGDFPKTSTVARKTMPYFLCTDDCQDVFQRGDVAFRELFHQLFVVGGVTAIKEALDNLVIFHGLSEQCRSDWYKQIPGGPIIDSKHICSFRPALNYKQQRILHDELIAKRRQWIQLRHQNSCSLTVSFSARWRDTEGKPLSESMVDRYLSPLANIVSVYIPRELNGLLKGNFKVTCADRRSAAMLHKALSNYPESDINRHDHPGEHSQESQHEFKKSAVLQEAVEWLRDIQRTLQPISKVRIDIKKLSEVDAIPAFTLTAHSNVGDTKIKKYFDHLCSFSFKKSQAVSNREKSAPLSFRFFGSPWHTCSTDRMWVNFDSRDNDLRLSKRKLFTVEFPCSPEDVKNLYQSVDFTPEDILDEYTQPYTQPIFDHTWFCACNQDFQSGKLDAGTRVEVTADISDLIILDPDEIRSLELDIDSRIGVTTSAHGAGGVGRRIMSSYAPQGNQVSRLKAGALGVLLFSGRHIRGRNQKVFPVRLESDHSIHFLPRKCFKVTGLTHARICWQPPELPVKLFDSEVYTKTPFCYLKITKKTKSPHQPSDKIPQLNTSQPQGQAKNEHDAQAEKQEQREFVEMCKHIFPIPAVSSQDVEGRLHALFQQFGIQDKDADEQKEWITTRQASSPGSPVQSLKDLKVDKIDRKLLSDFVRGDAKVPLLKNFTPRRDNRTSHGAENSQARGGSAGGGAVAHGSRDHTSSTASDPDHPQTPIAGQCMTPLSDYARNSSPVDIVQAQASHVGSWKTQIRMAELRQQIYDLNKKLDAMKNDQHRQSPWGCIRRLKQFFDDDDKNKEKFQRTLCKIGKLLNLDVHVDSFSESAFFVTVTAVNPSDHQVVVTAEMYELFEDNTFCGYIDEEEDTKKQPKKQSKRSQNTDPCPDNEGGDAASRRQKRFEISDSSLATLLASDMLRTPKGRHQVYTLLKAAQDQPLRKPGFDWWNDKYPVRVGISVDLNVLMSFLSSDFVRSSFNFAVKLCDAPSQKPEQKNETVNWFSQETVLTDDQLFQLVVQFIFCRANARSDSFQGFFKAAKDLLNETRRPCTEPSAGSFREHLNSLLSSHKGLVSNYLPIQQALNSSSQPDEYTSCVCMNCECICRFSCRFKVAIQNLLLPRHDLESKLCRHLWYYLRKALNGKNVASNCSIVLSQIKNCSEYGKAILHDLRQKVNAFESIVQKPSSDVAVSSDASAPSIEAEVPARSPSMRYSPQRFNAVREFLSTLDLDIVQEFAESEVSKSPTGDFCHFEDIFGASPFAPFEILDVLNADTLEECIAVCSNAVIIAFQARQGDSFMFWPLLQLCCVDGDGKYRICIVYLPCVMRCHQMQILINHLCCSEKKSYLLGCHSKDSETTFQNIAALFDKKPRSITILQNVLADAKSTSFRHLIKRAFGKSWNEEWKESGWDIFPLHPHQKQFAVLEVLATCRVLHLHRDGKLQLGPSLPGPGPQTKPEKENADCQDWSRIKSCCSDAPKLMDKKLAICRPDISPTITHRNEDPIKEPNASNILHRISELERQLLLELSTPRLSFVPRIATRELGGEVSGGGTSSIGQGRSRDTGAGGGAGVPKRGEGQRAVAVAGVGIPTHHFIQKVETAPVSPDDSSTSSLFGLQLIIRRQRFDSCPSVSEQVDCVNLGKSYVRFCVDGPLEDLSSSAQEIKISFKMASPNGTVDACNMNAELNYEPLDIVELKTNWKKGSGRVYGRIKDIDSRNLRLLFEPEYTFDGEVSVYPFLEVCLELGGKTLVAQVHSFHFKELVDGSALKCIESMKKLNALLLKKKDLDIVKHEFETLKDDALLMERGGGGVFKQGQLVVSRVNATPQSQCPLLVVRVLQDGLLSVIEDTVGRKEQNVSVNSLVRVHFKNTAKDSMLDFLGRPHVKSVGIVRIKINEHATTQEEHKSNVDTVQNKINNLLKGLEDDINKEDANVLTIGGSLKEGLNNKRRPLPSWSDSGQATAINILEKFKFFLHHKIEWVRLFFFNFVCGLFILSHYLIEVICQIFRCALLLTFAIPTDYQESGSSETPVRSRKTARTLLRVLFCAQVLLCRNAVF